jgi:signal transduction histidine kinase
MSCTDAPTAATAGAAAAVAAGAAADATTAEAPGGDGRWWRGVLVTWHTSFFVIVALVVLELGTVHGANRWIAVGTLGGLVAGYLVFARAWMHTNDGPAERRAGWCYLAVVTAAVCALTATFAGASTVLFGLMPQIYAMLERPLRWLAWTLPLYAAMITITVIQFGWSSVPGDTPSLIGAPLIGMTMVRFVGLLLGETERRGKLIAELERTRDELAEVHHQAGALAERERLAHEIHDTLAQGFTSILMLIQGADAAVDHAPRAAHERLALAERAARDNLAEARALIAALAPPDLLDTGLDVAIERICRRVEREMGIPVTVEITGPHRTVDIDTQVVLVRAVQEALANVRKHAGASTATVTVAYQPARVELRVADDGHGFANQNVDQLDHGYGLAGMRRRAEQLGGDLTIGNGRRGAWLRIGVPA